MTNFLLFNKLLSINSNSKSTKTPKYKIFNL